MEGAGGGCSFWYWEGSEGHSGREVEEEALGVFRRHGWVEGGILLPMLSHVAVESPKASKRFNVPQKHDVGGLKGMSVP